MHAAGDMESSSGRRVWECWSRLSWDIECGNWVGSGHHWVNTVHGRTPHYPTHPSMMGTISDVRAMACVQQRHQY